MWLCHNMLTIVYWSYFTQLSCLFKSDVLPPVDTALNMLIFLGKAVPLLRGVNKWQRYNDVVPEEILIRQKGNVAILFPHTLCGTHTHSVELLVRLKLLAVLAPMGLLRSSVMQKQVYNFTVYTRVLFFIKMKLSDVACWGPLWQKGLYCCLTVRWLCFDPRVILIGEMVNLESRWMNVRMKCSLSVFFSAFKVLWWIHTKSHKITFDHVLVDTSHRQPLCKKLTRGQGIQGAMYWLRPTSFGCLSHQVVWLTAAWHSLKSTLSCWICSASLAHVAQSSHTWAYLEKNACQSF